jgi:hypothetical protein
MVRVIFGLSGNGPALRGRCLHAKFCCSHYFFLALDAFGFGTAL